MANSWIGAVPAGLSDKREHEEEEESRGLEETQKEVK